MNTNVRNYLIELARKKTDQQVTYQKLSDDCRLGFNMQDSPYDRKQLGKILGEISAHEHIDDKRPLLSVLVIRAGDSYEGDGFYKLAEELGFGKWKELKDSITFDAIQTARVIDFWSDDKNYYLYK